MRQCYIRCGEALLACLHGLACLPPRPAPIISSSHPLSLIHLSHVLLPTAKLARAEDDIEDDTIEGEEEASVEDEVDLDDVSARFHPLPCPAPPL